MEAARSDLTRDQLDVLGDQIAEHAAHLDAAKHRLLADIRAFDAATGWSHHGARSCADWLSLRLGWDGNTSREHVRIAKALGTLPRIDDAFRRGALSYSKVRAMTRVATPEDDAERRRITKRDLDDGMVSINVTLHPEEAELLWTALTRIAKERDEKFSRIDALVEMADQVMRGTSPDRTPTDIVLTVPVDALDPTRTDELLAATTPDGTCLSIDAARRLACDCGLSVMIEDANGTCLSIGRKSRTIPASMKRALLRRDTTCRFPGCCNRVYLDGHHAKHWGEGGATSLRNLVTLCKYHHRFLHEYGFRVELDEQQRPRFYDARGHRLADVPPPPPPIADGRAVVARANASLSITASTALPRWDGDAPNYDWIVEDLCRADGLDDVSAETSAQP